MPSQEVISALEDLHRELERLEPAIKHVETAQTVTKTVKEIPEKHIALIEALKNDSNDYKETLTSLFSSKISGLSSETEKLIATTRNIQLQIESEQKSLMKLKEQIAFFHDKVERINFPERLDKLDATISGIMAGTQAIQSRLDNVERNLTDRLNEISNSQKESHRVLRETFSSAVNRLSLFHYITLALVVALLTLFILKG